MANKLNSSTDRLEPGFSAMSTELHPVVLVVEDEEAIRGQLVRQIEARGCRVFMAGDATAGLEEARLRRPALMVLDLGLPGRGGLDVLRVLREEAREVPTILFTGTDDPAETFEAAKLGAVGLVRKPATAGTVADVVDDALRSVSKIDVVELALDAAMECESTEAGHSRVRQILVQTLEHDRLDLIQFSCVCPVLLESASDPMLLTDDRINRIATDIYRLRERCDRDVLELIAAIERLRFTSRAGMDNQPPASRDLRARLRAVTGQGRHHWMVLSRLRQAIQQILRTNEHIGIIADRLGFADGAHISREVHDLVGASPRGLRVYPRWADRQ